jgi:CBS domain-containing protein
MQAKDIMTAGLIKIGPDAAIAEAAKRMVENRISALPVVDDAGSLVGIVSEGDLMRRSEMGTEKRRPWWLAIVAGDEELAHDFTKAHGQQVKDVMTRKVITASEDWPLEKIARTLEEQHIKRVIVLRQGKPVGIVSRADLLRAFATRPVAAAAPSVGDHDLRHAVTEALVRKEWGGGVAAPVTVIVEGGVVHLWGVVGSETVREAMRIAAQEVPGVKRVEAHLKVGYRNWAWGE